MNQLVELVNSRVAKFKVEDWFLLKLAITIVGVIIGCTFSETCKKLRALLVMVWVGVFTYLVLRIFVLGDKIIQD